MGDFNARTTVDPVLTFIETNVCYKVEDFSAPETINIV
jgi:hypothetical protein